MKCCFSKISTNFMPMSDFQFDISYVFSVQAMKCLAACWVSSWIKRIENKLSNSTSAFRNWKFLKFSGIKKHISVLLGKGVLLAILFYATVSINLRSGWEILRWKTKWVIYTVDNVLWMQRSKKKDFQSYIYTYACVYVCDEHYHIHISIYVYE